MPKVGVTNAVELTTQQARVLIALKGKRRYDKDVDSVLVSPSLTRAKVAAKAGFTEASGSTTRAFNGIREGNTTSGKPHKGLIALGYAVQEQLEVEDVTETVYRITIAGQRAIEAWLETHELTTIKDKTKTTNKRYSKDAKE